MSLTTKKFDELLAAVLEPPQGESVTKTRDALANSAKLILAYQAAISVESLTGSSLVTQLLFAAVFEAGRKVGTEESIRAMLEGK